MPSNTGTNPFDRFVAPKDLEVVKEMRKVNHAQELQAVDAEIQRQTQAAFDSANRYEDAWKDYQEQQHVVRRKAAEENTPVEVRQELHPNQAEQNRLDDDRFGWIVCYDQLLQLHNHEDYLRASRSFERRRARAKVTGKPIPAPWSLGRLWTVATLVVLVVFILAAAKESVVGAFFLAIVGLPLWAITTRLPGIVGGVGEPSGRGGSTAV